ncbi:Transglutaminase-like enzyme, putative cysteine protease [Deinococcus reticulitermitis]|uniref:Transglutaminase-like enzyme, putative cysteine protease n=1 Tax=Deinococcus reticulitermitis TaxID=856736 RepID=A0A1H6W2J6_9DEIO|nr:transglutaminase family protein [Deinococcus reticulitermitis]SEJ11159.1 Transglutaminase-like enzyme, putative cysteine protease [Deinococcus reticulitermitis]
MTREPLTSSPFEKPVRVRAGFSLTFDVPFPTPMLFVVQPQERLFPTGTRQRIVDARPLGAAEGIHSYTDIHGNLVWRTVAQPGEFTIGHDLIAEVERKPDAVLPHLRKTPVEELPDEVIGYLLPSRYVDSDLISPEAWDRFGQVQGGWNQVQAISDHLFDTCAYGYGSNSTTTASQALASGRAVCRDFAHMGVAFCRALNIPARYVCGYMPDIDYPPDPVPMDFHAWFEAFIDGEWRTFDARHNQPRVGRVLIAQGRDASDVAFTTSFGAANLVSMKVWADETEFSTTLDLPPNPRIF